MGNYCHGVDHPGMIVLECKVSYLTVASPGRSSCLVLDHHCPEHKTQIADNVKWASTRLAEPPNAQADAERHAAASGLHAMGAWYARSGLFIM